MLPKIESCLQTEHNTRFALDRATQRATELNAVLHGQGDRISTLRGMYGKNRVLSLETRAGRRDKLELGTGKPIP